MAGATVTISGVTGGVLNIDVMSPSGASPGRITANVFSSANIPETGHTITMMTDTVTLTWTDCRLVKTPRLSRSGARIVLEDSRWKMRETVMQQSFNPRLVDGRVAEQTSLTDLWAAIASATGLTIATSGLPTLYPPADWAGKTAEWCANKLLKDTVCRLNYDASAQTYRVMPCGTGTTPAVTTRAFRQVAITKPTNINVYAEPTLYEGEVATEAVIPDSSGELVTIASDAAVDAIDLFTGFQGLADSRRQAVQNTAFRLWRATGVTHPAVLTHSEIRLFGHRLQTVSPSAGRSILLQPEAEADRIFNAPMFHEDGASKTKSVAEIQLTDGERLFMADRTILPVDASGNIELTLDIRCAYARLDANGVPTRETTSRVVTGGTAPDLDVYVDWIRAVDSDDDTSAIDETHAATVLGTIADALKVKHEATTEHLELSSLVDCAGSGQVGGAMYHASLLPNPRLETTVYFNFTPHQLTLK